MQRLTFYLGVAAIVAVNVSCGKVPSSNGRGSSFIVIDSLQGIRGAVTAGTPSSTLISDVITNVVTPDPCSTAAPCPTVFGDNGRVTMHVVMKDSGSAAPTTPTPLNDITLSQYRVVYRRADGRNTPGVDIPFPFDSFVTVTVTPGATAFGFSLVRVQAKQEPPLVLLKNPLAGVLTGFADITFFGKDQTGAEVSVTGTIQIDFGNFGDTAS
jgi:hypothetical protein